MEFIQAKWFTPASRKKSDIWWLVIHDAQIPEKGSAAEAIANYFAAGCPYRKSDGSTGYRKASSHYVSDNNSTVQCVKDTDVAYGASGANAHGLHFEQAGYASQSTEEWLDRYGIDMLSGQLAPLLRSKAEEYSLPKVFLRAPDLKAGKKGITTHHEVEQAWPSSGHSDPGPGFPIGYLMDLVLGRQDPEVPPPAPRPKPERWFDMFIARDSAISPDLTQGYELDHFGGIHPLTPESPAITDGPYWNTPVAIRLVVVRWGPNPQGYVQDGAGGMHPFGGLSPFPQGPTFPL